MLTRRTGVSGRDNAPKPAYFGVRDTLAAGRSGQAKATDVRVG
jgi:hypothetical protein